MSISDGAFRWCGSLANLTIPDSVRSIGNRTFSGCDSLTSLPLPAGVTDIGEDAFDGCEELTLAVTKGSYAAYYAKGNNKPYAFVTEYTMCGTQSAKASI